MLNTYADRPDGGLSYIHILSAEREHIDRAIICVIYQVNTMKHVAAMEPKTTLHNYIHILCSAPQ